MDKVTLKNARQLAGFSLQEVAKLIDRSVATISDWENGKTEPKIGDAIKLAKIYDRSIEGIDFRKEANE